MKKYIFLSFLEFLTTIRTKHGPRKGVTRECETENFPGSRLDPKLKTKY